MCVLHVFYQRQGCLTSAHSSHYSNTIFVLAKKRTEKFHHFSHDKLHKLLRLGVPAIEATELACPKNKKHEEVKNCTQWNIRLDSFLRLVLFFNKISENPKKSSFEKHRSQQIMQKIMNFLAKLISPSRGGRDDEFFLPPESSIRSSSHNLIPLRAAEAGTQPI